LPRRLTLADEKRLIRKHRRGDKRALPALLATVMPFLHSLAGQVARYTGARDKDLLEDLEQEACLVFCERVKHYDLTSQARVENYAYPWIMSRLNKHACDALEIVRTPHDGVAHKAHRQIDQLGRDPDEVAAELGISRERVVALVRHTVSLPDTLEHEAADTSAERTLAARTAWMDEIFSSLAPPLRRIIALMESVESASERFVLARRIPAFEGCDRYTYGLLEQEAIAHLRALGTEK